MSRERQNSRSADRESEMQQSDLAPGSESASSPVDQWREVIQEHLRQCRQLEDALDELLKRTNQAGQ